MDTDEASTKKSEINDNINKDKFSNDNDFTNLIDRLLEEYFIKEEQTL